MEKKPQVNYDSEEDILSIIKSETASHSARIGDVMLDFGSDMRIVGVEIMNSVRFFEAFELSREDLGSIKGAKLAVYYSEDWAVIKITLDLGARESPVVKDFTIPSLKEQEQFAGMEA